MPQAPTRADFDAAYDRFILNRTFVERPEYYEHSRERFWRALCYIARLDLPEGCRTLDIGGGLMAVLLKSLLGHAASVGDVVDTAAADVTAAGLGFTRVNLFRDDAPPAEPFDLVVLQEVIEHIPQPPYLVFRRIARFLRPGGVLFLTTPNGFRFRNIVNMLRNREILDHYRWPEGDEAMGHQHEYTLRQMLWQFGHAGFTVLMAEHYEDGWRGATPAARLLRRLAAPVSLVPHLRNGLVMAARAPA